MKALLIIISILFFNSCQKNNNEKSNLIEGDFNGDGITETAKLIKLDKESKDFKYYYEIIFSNKEIKKINISSQSDVYGINNENDLNNDNSDELSIIFNDRLENNCVNTMFIRKFENGKWSFLIDPITISLECGKFKMDIQDYVIKENDHIKFFSYESNLTTDKSGKIDNASLQEKIIRLK